MKHLTVYFSDLFFYIFSDEFYWILCQGSPAVILWRYKNVNLILAPEFHLFFFYFRNFISFFPCFSKTCRKLQFPEFFSHFYILILADAFTSYNQLIFRPYLHHFPLCLVPSLAFISSSFSFCPLRPLFSYPSFKISSNIKILIFFMFFCIDFWTCLWYN